jgi:rhodanese-related sulfurtransferase
MSRKKSRKPQHGLFSNRAMQLGGGAAILIAIVVVALVVTAGGGGKVNAPTTYTTLNVEDAYDRFSQTNGAVIVDVRNPDEWATTGIPPGAVLIPLPEFEERGPAELPEDQEIFVICNTGNRSRAASQILIDAGYTDVINIDDGIQAWVQAGLPIEAYTP